MLADERRSESMATFEIPQGGWNLFASVLQEILAAHGLGLGHLDDRANIHREKVRRLQLSLKVPKSFPVLNIDEMEQVITVFQLNRNEKTRLRAAILATSIEETLMDRINPEDALKAAEQIFGIIEQALQARDSFTLALAELDKATPDLKVNDAWQVWHDEAQNGLTTAQSRLASLGA